MLARRKFQLLKKGLHYFQKNTITEKDFAKKIKSNHFIYIKYKIYFSKYYFWHFYLIFDKKLLFIFGPENSPRLHWRVPQYFPALVAHGEEEG